MARSLKVLLVDDDPVTLEVTRAILENLGHRVLTRDRALGTTSVIFEERPDVVLLDINMPAISGHELLRVIRERSVLRKDREPRFILYSGVDAATLRRLVEETGALGGIEKTSSPAAFASAFEELLRH